MKYSLIIPFALVLSAGTALADDARMSYKMAGGATAAVMPVSAVCSVSADGVPQLCGDALAGSEVAGTDGRLSYKTTDGQTMTAMPVVPVCSVSSTGKPQICDLSGMGSNTTAGLIVGDENVVTANGTWPTTDPLVAGQAWQDGGVMMLSTGSKAAPNFSADDLTVGSVALANKLAAMITATSTAQTTASAAIPLSQKGATSGVASLDASGNVTAPINTTGASEFGGNVAITNGTAVTFHGPSGTTAASSYMYGDSSGNISVSGSMVIPTLTASTAAAVPDTSTTDSSTAALNTESASTRFLSKSDASNYVSASALSSYLTTSTAASTYAPLASPALTGTPTAPTPATTDNSTTVATTAYVNNAFNAVEYSVQGDISTSGSSIQIPFGTSGLYAKFAYTGSGSASMSFYSTSGTLSPVDIRRNSIWGGSGVETYTLDNGSVTTSGVTADSTVYTQSNDSSAYFIRVGGQVYFLTVWASNNGARAFMGVHKMI